MNRKELNKTFMMITNCNKPFGLQGFSNKKLALQGLKTLWVGHVPTRILIFFLIIFFLCFLFAFMFQNVSKKIFQNGYWGGWVLSD